LGHSADAFVGQLHSKRGTASKSSASRMLFPGWTLGRVPLFPFRLGRAPKASALFSFFLGQLFGKEFLGDSLRSCERVLSLIPLRRGGKRRKRCGSWGTARMRLLASSIPKEERRPKVAHRGCCFRVGRSGVFLFFHSAWVVPQRPSLFSPFSWGSFF